MHSKAIFEVSIELRILMGALTRLSARAIDDAMSEHKIGLTGLQYGILRALSYQTFTLSDLSRKFVMDPSTLVPTVDTLERKGFVERGKDPSDRRRTPLLITEQGQSVLGSIGFLQMDDGFARSVEAMGEDRARQLLELLRELMRTIPEGEAMLTEMQTHLHAHRHAVNQDDDSTAPGCYRPTVTDKNE